MRISQYSFGLANADHLNGVRLLTLLAKTTLLAAVLFACSCTPSPASNQVAVPSVEAIGKEFITSSETVDRLFRNKAAAPDSGFRIEVFVDQSASMRGYADFSTAWSRNDSSNRKQTAPATAPVSSAFTQLLRQLANEGELLSFYGFGSDLASNNSEHLTNLGTTPPIDGSKFVRTNNDYADLLRLINDRPQKADGLPIQRIIVTDGVQSHRDLGAGSALSKTVTALHDWIHRGGIVEIRVLTAPFAGTYYSEELRSRKQPVSFKGRTTNRPFLVVSLLSGEAILPAWKAFWTRSAFSGLEISSAIQVPSEPETHNIVFEPEEKIAKDSQVQVLYKNVWDLSSVQVLDDYHNIWRALVRRIRTQHVAEPPTFPASFLLKGFGGKTQADAEATFRAWKPTFEVWQHVEQQQKPTTSPAPGPTWQRREFVDLRDFKNESVTVSWLGPPTNAFRLLATPPVPARGAVQPIVLTAIPPDAAPTPPNFTSFSTSDDSSPENLKQIYNLQPFVEQLSAKLSREPERVGALVLTYR